MSWPKLALLLILCQTRLLKVDGATSPTTVEMEELEEVGGPTVEEDDSSEESEDEEEAFSDLEDEAMLCADFVAQVRQKRLPDAIIIGARKVRGGIIKIIDVRYLNKIGVTI